MSLFEKTLHDRLNGLRAQNLARELRRVDSAQGPRIQLNGANCLNFSANDYLGLVTHPALKAAAIAAIEKFGTGAGAARLVSGSVAPFHELESALAKFKQCEAALTFATGYAAALGTITALAGPDDILIMDKLAHACLVDAAHLAGSRLRVFRHNDLESLEDKLRWATAHRPAGGQIFIITESIFSMDGDAAPLTEIVQLKERYEATLMVDEAHATGLLGPQGRGLIHELGLSGRIEIQMGTLGKALGASGGYICGQRVLIDYLVNRARSFIFSTAPVPAAAAAALAGLQIAASSEGDERRRHCRELGDFFERSTRAFKLPTTPARGMIRPIMMGDETAALEAAAALQKQNVFVPAIRYPTVARGAARLRVCLTAAHTGMDVAQLCDALNQTALTARAHA